MSKHNSLEHLLEKNRDWAAGVESERPGFFQQLSQQQTPEILWIGCADSRVPANQIVDLLPGEVFVHRNIANVVVHSDLNCLSVVQYAVEVLKVKHIIVCGHYGCGGVQAALTGQNIGLINNWLAHIKDVYRMHQSDIDALETEKEKVDLLCERNVIEQVANVSQTAIVQDAWNRGQELTIHGWVYGLDNGRVKELGCAKSSTDDVLPSHRLV
ncbi:carbonate dehydratase [Persicirhabdus sediminis]|uniref:Carbonic anhydrase n=1 Tax=Persicirhabdus sediminis TaxID=454144 RepID=A0A8J7MFB4_9BACT|nr:carbonate dehydratase [Persicirhabdus sediminis]MBK1791690.1 carbonate dehydratase [Persicirhabdus sediminis]